MFSRIGVTELLIILAIALVIFGPTALPKLGKSIGKTIGSFKKGLNEESGEENEKPQDKDGV
ncbi:MAG: twin-arginine translocase TatA/TatE family subunit [Eubacteriales bacterium]|nr:twin-arginine translocase TatA/TatE family subunit [Eubacteriales bacterium]